MRHLPNQRTGREFRTEFRAMLSCGHTIPLRDSPRSERAKYGCRAGKGCGYTLWWVEEWSVKNPEKRNVNRLYRENEERAKAE